MVGIPDLSESGGQDGSMDTGNTQWKVISGTLTYEGRIYVPADDALTSKVISVFHDNPKSGDFGALRTAEPVSRDFFWTAMNATVRKYIAGCAVCHQIKAPRHARHGVNMPLLPPSQPWEGVTVGFITDLSESTASGCPGILVGVDRLTSMAIYPPCRKDIDSPELAWMFFEHVSCEQGVQDNIITDRGTQFTSRFWTRVCSHMSIDHRLSTAFHPQTYGQTERQKQTIEQYLRAFCIYEQDNQVKLLPLVEFVYNNPVHTSTMMTPFWAVYHRHPEMPFEAPKVPANPKCEIQPDALPEGLEETHRLLPDSILDAQERQTKNAGGKEITFEVGDIVWLSTKHFRSTRPSKKLDYTHAGPYTVSEIINQNAYKLDLPKMMWNHNVFYV